MKAADEFVCRRAEEADFVEEEEWRNRGGWKERRGSIEEEDGISAGAFRKRGNGVKRKEERRAEQPMEKWLNGGEQIEEGSGGRAWKEGLFIGDR